MNAANIRILVVDDDPDVLLGTARLLEHAGYTVDRASGGEASLQAVRDHQPDLVLLDRDLPGIDGVDVCALIKRDPALADLLVVMVSGSYTASDEQAEGLEAGADGYITRPIANRELLARVESFARIIEHKRVEEALRRSEAFLSVVYNNSDIGIFVVEVLANGRYVYSGINPTHERLMGVRNADIVGKSPDALVAHFGPETVAYVKALYDECVRTKEPRASEFHIPTGPAQGWWLSRVTPIVDERTGLVVRLMGSGLNITERKLAEEALRASHQRLSLALDGGELGMWDWDLRTDAVSYSDRWAQMLEYPPDEVEPSVDFFKRHVHPDDLPAVLERLTGHVEGRSRVYASEHRLRTKSGRLFWVMDHGRVVEHDENGRPVRVAGIIADITDRKKIETSLQESEGRYRSLVEGTPGIVYAYSSTRGGLYYSPRVTDILGHSPEQLLADPELWHDSIHPDDVALVERSVAAAITGKPFAIEYRIRDAHDDWHWFDDRSTDLHRSAAETVVEGFALDITARKRAEEQQTRLEAQLQQAQKMESVGRLAGGVAHDFNNMLGVILGHAEVALIQLAPDQPLHTHLTEIREAALRSAALTRQLLAFARKQIIAPKILDLNATVAGMRSMLVRLLGEDLDLRWQPGAALWPVEMDPSQVDQILANLCVNARDAIADVGKVTIETANTTLDEAYCALHAGYVPGEYVRLTVSDDGCGMDAETQAQIFEPFFTTKAAGQGTGLGLATVYGIVKQNHGFINVYSEPGHGTTFTIYLPRHAGAGAAAAARAERAADPLTRGHETILLVEDEPSILTLTATVLREQGYTVLAAGTPGEAIRLAKEHTGAIHLLMTDVVMPEMNGRDLARNLLSLYPQMRRLFMSGYTANVIAHHGVLDDGVHFIQKPFSIDSLAAKVREALDEA